MSLDERMEALAMHLEALTRVHEDFERRMTAYAADVRDAVQRLTNIAAAHDQRLDEHDERIDRLEH